MADNLVSRVMQTLTSDLIGRIAAALGIDRNTAETAIRAAVPALLAAFSGVAAKPGGAQNLADAVKQQSGVLDGLARTISGGGQSSLIDKGSQLLTSLLGRGDQSALAGAIAQFSGLSQGVSGSLLGLLAPVALGTIGKQFGATDAQGLAGLLGTQRDQIAQALPSGLRSMLQGTGILGAVAGTAGAAAGEAARAASVATDQAGQFAASAARAAGNTGQRAAAASTSALYWVVPLIVILAGALWYAFANRAEQPTETAATATQSVVVGGVDVGKQLDESLSALGTSLKGVTDEASAKAALPRLQDVTTKVDKIASTVGQLSPEQRKIITAMVGPAMANLNPLFDKVVAIPGAGQVLKPSIDALKTNLATLAA